MENFTRQEKEILELMKNDKNNKVLQLFAMNLESIFKEENQGKKFEKLQLFNVKKYPILDNGENLEIVIAFNDMFQEAVKVNGLSANTTQFPEKLKDNLKLFAANEEIDEEIVMEVYALATGETHKDFKKNTSTDHEFRAAPARSM